MHTFSELQAKLNAAKNRKTVLMHLIDLLEGEFVSPSADTQPKRLLLSDEKIPVPQSAFNDVVDDLMKEVEELTEEADTILQSTLKSSKEDENKAA